MINFDLKILFNIFLRNFHKKFSYLTKNKNLIVKKLLLFLE
jgi:hypothetical protein